MNIEVDDARWAQIEKIVNRDRLPVATMLDHMLDFAIECSEPTMDAEAVETIGRTDFSAVPHS